jgi:signal transduction histidine kinase
MADQLPAHVLRSRADWRPDSWSLRTKISTVLLLPVLVAIALAGLRIHTELAQTDALTALGSQVPVLQAVAQLADQTNIQLVDSASTPDSQAFATQADAVRRSTSNLQAQAELVTLDPATAGSLNAALGQLAGLPANTARAGPVSDTTAYHDALFALAGVVPSIVAPAGDNGLNSSAAALATLLQLRTDLAVEQALLASPAGTTELVAASRAATEEVVLGSQAQHEIPAALAPEEATATSAAGNRLNQVATGMASGHLDRTGPLQAIDAENVQLGRLTNSMVQTLSTDVTTLSTAAKSAALRDTALVLAALLGALAVALQVARSVVFPIRKLHDAAIDAAQRLLPDTVARMRAGEDVDWRTVTPVAVPGNEEIGQLARAFDDMHGQAVRLAGEQAELRNQVSEMFMTLSRRSQSLVESQLTVIDRLESDEQDPQRLDELFRVDHLATRLRRNGENLQVLAGGQPVRHDHGPMSAVELLRAATSEVKDYRRIALGNAPYGAVRAPAGEDVVHILAELLDNATRYSNPAEKVLLTADRGADGGLLFEVVDTGLGMTVEDIVAANDRLAVGGAVTPETTRRMGLFVVGRLAAPHGVTVRLRRTSVGSSTPGITASVHVPGDLVVTDRTDGLGRPFQLTPTPETNGHALLDEPDQLGVRSGDLPLDWPMPPAAPTPIFDRMASRWFDELGSAGSAGREWSPAEVEGARRSAATAVEPVVGAELSPAGLPTRVPGAQLAPGAAQEREPGDRDGNNGFRDPLAVRANLARHYSGVRAARRATTTSDDAEIES